MIAPTVLRMYSGVVRAWLCPSSPAICHSGWPAWGRPGATRVPQDVRRDVRQARVMSGGVERFGDGPHRLAAELDHKGRLGPLVRLAQLLR